MKLHGITGTGSGKLGSSVFSVTAGEQIVRQYQPVVTNPSTTSQVNNRARLKLLSQLSAVMADVIAIPRAGTLSPRNIFVSDNYQISSAVNGAASIDLASVTLTKGGMQIPAVVAERDGDSAINVALAEKADQLVTRVIYIMFYRNNVGELQLVDSVVVETAGDDGTFPYVLPYVSQDVIVYAYGIFDKNSKATAKFGNYAVTSGTQLASLIANRKLDESDYLITKTRGVVLVGETTAVIDSVSANNVSIAANGSTSVPFSTGVIVDISTTDAVGMYGRLLVDGVGGTPVLNEFNTLVLETNYLAGGENIRVQLGTMNGSTFVPSKTYGGTIAVAAQTSAFTSVAINGVAITSSGQTQVAQALNSSINVNATGVTNKYLRVSINNVAGSPVAFNNGSAVASYLSPAIGDNVTFQIGRVINDTFVEDVAYGGTAVIAEVPASFTSIVVNGTTLAASGSTNVAPSTPNNYVIHCLNASGKYLALMDGNNQVLSVHAISGDTISITDNAADGDVRKFAIGTGATTSAFVAQTTFAGEVSFVEVQEVAFSNIIVGGMNINQHTEIAAGSYNFSGATDLTGAANTKAFFVRRIGKPSVGVMSDTLAAEADITNGTFSGTIQLSTGYTYWLCIGYVDGGSTYNISAVYDYNVSAPGGTDD